MVADEAGLQLEGLIDSAGPVGTGAVKTSQPGMCVDSITLLVARYYYHHYFHSSLSLNIILISCPLYGPSMAITLHCNLMLDKCMHVYANK